MGVVVEQSQEPLKILTVVNYRNVQVVRCLVSDLAHGSRSYHPAAAGTNARSVSTPGPSRTIPSISANISTAPPSTSDISITSNISHVSPSVSGVPPSVSDTISSTPGVPGISAGPGIPEPLPFYPNYGAHMSFSSHTSSNLVMTPLTSPAHLCYPTPFIGSPTSTVAIPSRC